MTGFKHPTVILAAALALSGCVTTPVASDGAGSLTAALSGRTLTNESGSLRLAANGSLSGTVGGNALTGAWTERNGQFCRTIAEPARLVGTACQDVIFNNDGTVTINNITWTLS